MMKLEPTLWRKNAASFQQTVLHGAADVTVHFAEGPSELVYKVALPNLLAVLGNCAKYHRLVVNLAAMANREAQTSRRILF
jgi:hypothetical protein